MTANLLKRIPTIVEIECAKEHSRFPLLVALVPALRNQFPFRGEVSAKFAAIFGFCGREEYGYGVVSRRGR
jgi:hypothetical protein